MTDYIYAIEPADLVKIGWSSQPHVRLSQVKYDTRNQSLKLIGCIEGDWRKEQRIHAALDEWRMKGEWFRKEGAVLDFLKSLGPVPPKQKNQPIGYEALKSAIAKTGAREIAKALGVSIQAIHQWPRVPPERVIQVEKVTGICREDLRPDLFPREIQSK